MLLLQKTGVIAGIVIGLTLAFVHIRSISLTGTSLIPARSVVQALFMGVKSLNQLLVFIVGPFIGSILAVFSYKFFVKDANEGVKADTEV